MGTMTAVSVKALTAPGRYGDGDGLYLDVAPGGARTWIIRIQSVGKRRDIGLGSAKTVTLAEARSLALDVKRKVRAGIDPVAERKAARAKMTVPTFRQAATLCHGEHAPTWRNAKHAAQWLATLETYAYPALGSLPVNAIEAPAVRDVLSPIWLTVPETARRVRQRIGAVLDWAHGKGYRAAPLIVADNISTLCRSGKVNEAESWSTLQGWALTQRRAGRSVLFLHHAGKGGEQRGTSRREDIMDTVIKLSRPADYQAGQGARMIVEFTKARGIMGDDAEAFEAQLKDGEWSQRSAVNVRDEQIIALPLEIYHSAKLRSK